MQPDYGPSCLAIWPDGLGERLSRAADHHAPGPPRCQHVIDHQGDVRVALRIVKFPAPGEVAAADVDDVQFGVVAPAEGNDVRHTGGVDGREPAELALGQVGQFGVREHTHSATHPPVASVNGNDPDATRADPRPRSHAWAQTSGSAAGRVCVRWLASFGASLWPEWPLPTLAGGLSGRQVPAE